MPSVELAAEAGDLDEAVALLAESDVLAPQVAHLVDEGDRYDAAAARRRTTEPGVGGIT